MVVLVAAGGYTLSLTQAVVIRIARAFGVDTPRVATYPWKARPTADFPSLALFGCTMKRTARVLFAALLAASSAVIALRAQSPAATPSTGRVPRVAVVDFEYATVHSTVNAI